MQTLRICDVGLSSDASHAFHSMLGIVNGRSNAAWSLSAIGEADVLLAEAGGDPDVIDRWTRTGKPVVMVTGDQRHWPSASFVLRHPFRVMQLLTMLDSVAEHVGTPAANCATGSPSWPSGESLRRLMTQSVAHDWHVAQCGDGARLWVSEGVAFGSPSTLRRLREGNLPLGEFVQATDRPADGCERLPLKDAAWHIGLQGPAGLASWLPGNCAFRLRRWPDFGRLGVDIRMIELSAHCATRAFTPASLVDRTGLELDVVQRFLAAASLAGLLAQAPRSDDTHVSSSRVAVAETGWTRLLGGLRRRLGIGA